MKKKITAIFLCVALVAIAVVGASLAYFSDTKTATNTFTMGNVKITLDETDITNPDGKRVTSNEYDVYPGAVVAKDPVVHNTGKNEAYVRAVVTIENGMNWLGLYNDNVWTGYLHRHACRRNPCVLHLGGDGTQRHHHRRRGDRGAGMGGRGQADAL